MNQATIAIIIVLTCILILPIYYRSTNFIKLPGILIFILGFFTLALRVFKLEKSPSFYNPQYFLSTVTLLGVPLIIFTIYEIFRTKMFRGKRLYFIKLLTLYLLFGALQQILFIYVVTDSLFVLTGSKFISLMLGAIYFFLFHLNWNKLGIIKLLPLLSMFGFLTIFAYLWWGNIYPQLIIHGIAGAVLFTAYQTPDQIKLRLKS